MKSIEPSNVRGATVAPPSKSMSIRVMTAAYLAGGLSYIEHPSCCDDAIAALGILKTLGASCSEQGSILTIYGGGVPQGNFLNARESGLCMRMFPALAALRDKEFVLSCNGTMAQRPIDFVIEPLKVLGAQCEMRADALVIRGPLLGGDVTIDGSVTSQFLTGLLMALPLCERDSIVRVVDPTSIPYISLTLALLKQYGIDIQRDDAFETFFISGGQKYKPRRTRIEGDWSSAAPMLVAGALAGSVSVTGLDMLSEQADRMILPILEEAGARVVVASDGAISVEKRVLKSFACDVTHCPDLSPSLVALACFCHGTSSIAGIHRLRYKESDRAAVLMKEFEKLGARISCTEHIMTITGTPLSGGIVSAHGDHRIAMALAVAALGADDTVFIEGWESVAKSYPSFFSDLESLYE